MLTTESDHAECITIERALGDVGDGTMEMLQPTRHTLRQLCAIGDRPVQEAAMGRRITAIEPRLVEIDGVRYLDGPARSSDDDRHPPGAGRGRPEITSTGRIPAK
jgi:hypothetical protein